jgi:serine/threonine-protein kinase
LREGYVANQIAHPGVVRITDDDDDDEFGTVFLVMELLRGETIDARWERCGRRLPLAEVIAIADRTLHVLAAAHAKGVIHRDINPENLFLGADGQLRVLDFGIARLLDGTSATRDGQLLGTPAFMSPEQAHGRVREIDARSDLWSVGATMFTLLSGEHVHRASTTPEQRIYAATLQARSLVSVTAGIPRSIASSIDCALAYDKAHRFSSAEEMRMAVMGQCR